VRREYDCARPDAAHQFQHVASIPGREMCNESGVHRKPSNNGLDIEQHAPLKAVNVAEFERSASQPVAPGRGLLYEAELLKRPKHAMRSALCYTKVPGNLSHAPIGLIA
jgi:hypothetical protein